MVNKHKSIKVIILLIIVILIFTNIKVYAFINNENRNFKHITIDDGLSQGSVSTIIQDSNGYMWIGTGDGLNRYNGYKFKIYKYSENNEDSISGNIIKDIKEDDEGNIWVGTTTGLNKIDVETNKITRYLPNKNGCTISNYSIKKIMISKSGEILVGTDDGLNKYDKKNDNFERIYNTSNEDYSLTNQEIYSLTEDINGNYWIGTKDGLNKIDKKTGKVEKYLEDKNDENSISFNFIYSLYADDLGYLWIGTYYGGLNKLNLETGKIEKFINGDKSGLPGALIRDVIRDDKGIVWVATDCGFSKLIDETNKFLTYKTNEYDSGSIISNDILSICIDKSGSIWLGSGNGISFFNPENSFNYYKFNPFNGNSLSSNCISGIYEDKDGLLWVGTVYDGLNIIDRKNNKVTRINSKQDYEGELTINNNMIRDITGIDNEVWIGTERSLNKYDKDTGKITSYEEKDGLRNSDVRALKIDRDGVLWIGTLNGLFSFDRKRKFTDYSKILNNAGIECLEFRDIYEDVDGVLWISTGVEDGLIRFNKNNNEIKTYDIFNRDKSANNNNYGLILTINADNKDNIWIGTDNGLMKFNKNTEEYTKYNESNGLPNNFIYGILFEDDKNLWVSTNNGISKFDIEKEKFINFNSTDGIQGNEFNNFSYFRSDSGELFFGGTNGLTTFMPTNIKKKSFITPVKIESIYSNYGSIKLEDKIKLNYRNNQLKFEFFMPDYSNMQKLKYSYKLLGLDNDWITSEDIQSASYSNLKPGKYEFQVMARNSSGELSKATCVKINISNPPWKTPSAYLVYMLLIVIIIYLIWNRVKLLDNLVKQRTIELNNKLIENKILYSKLLIHEKYRNNYFINLSHELRTPLNIISSTESLIESLNNQNKKITKDRMDSYMKTIKRNCSRLVNLIDNILHTSNIECGNYKLNIKEHDIVFLVEEVTLSMRDLADYKGIELIIDPLIEEKTVECDELEIERVIINLISNAVKFTEQGGTIKVQIWDLDDFIKISVKDNGIGIDHKYHESIFDRFSQEYSDISEEYGGNGLGLTLSRQLIELHGGSIWVESEKGKGSEFIIKLPVKQI